MTSLSRLQRRAFLASLTALSLGLVVSCAPSNPDVATSPSGASPAASPSAGGGGASVSLSGAGASFPAPVYQRWFADYNKEKPTVQISYQSVGSGAGVEQFLAKTVDFGASDAPLKAEEREKFKSANGGAEPIQVPMVSGAIVLAYNLDGVDKLSLSRDAYCGIVTGKIKQWNDPAIASANSGVKLPNDPIQFVHRSDGSGTTFQFTNHIKAACPDWKAGANKSVEWPTGTGAKGNEGVTAQIQQTPGAVGYVEYAYAKQNGLKMAGLANKSGKVIDPSPDTAALAFKGQTVPKDFALLVPNPGDAGAYPIAGLTWMLFYPKYQDSAKAQAIKDMVSYALTTGKSAAQELGYVPVNDELSKKVQDEVTTIK